MPAVRKRKRKDWWNDEASDASEAERADPPPPSGAAESSDSEAAVEADEEEEGSSADDGDTGDEEEGEEEGEEEDAPAVPAAQRRAPSRRGPAVLMREVARFMALRPDPLSAPGPKPVRGAPVLRADAWEQWCPDAAVLPEHALLLERVVRARWVAERDAGHAVAPLPLTYLVWASEWARNGVALANGGDWMELPQFELGRVRDENELVAVCGGDVDSEAISRIACRHCKARAVRVMTVQIRRGDESASDIRRCGNCGERT